MLLRTDTEKLQRDLANSKHYYRIAAVRHGNGLAQVVGTSRWLRIGLDLTYPVLKVKDRNWHRIMSKDNKLGKLIPPILLSLIQ